MSYPEDIIKLRKKIADAVAAGVVGEDKNIYEATLIQIMNEAERQRQVCANQAESLRKQASMADGQAAGYAAMNNIIYGILNSYIVQAEKSKIEIEARQQEKTEISEFAATLDNKEKVISSPKTKKK